MVYSTLRPYLPLLLLSLSGGVQAIGFGELKGNPILGESLRLEVEILGVENRPLESGCFHLIQPGDEAGLPWLRRASLNLRPGTPVVLEIRSSAAVREPAFQLALEIRCGFETRREFVVIASPPGVTPPPRSAVALPEESGRRDSPVVERKIQRPRMDVPVSPPAQSLPPENLERKPKKPLAISPRLERMTTAAGESGAVQLRLATALGEPDTKLAEARRDVLRLEFRMLSALNEQAVTQLAAAEKLRSMEATLGELQRQASEFAERVEKTPLPKPAELPHPASVAAPVTVPAAAPASGPAAVPPAPLPRTAVVRIETEEDLPLLGIFGFLGGALLGVAGWFGWRRYRASQGVADDACNDAETVIAEAPETVIVMAEESAATEMLQGKQEIDFSFDPVNDLGPATEVDFQVGESLLPEIPMQHGAEASYPAAPAPEDSEVPTPVVNPVMELADIMLSFGRVKGAAQTLQDYIDGNPQEALQPWVRLLDVYRMADMREEFEKVARELNRNFNVMIPSWEPVDAGDAASGGLSLVPVSEPVSSLENIPRLMTKIVELWEAGDVLAYLNHLLRDNRAGERQGFPLAIIDEILFLIELKELVNRVRRET